MGFEGPLCQISRTKIFPIVRKTNKNELKPPSNRHIKAHHGIYMEVYNMQCQVRAKHGLDKFQI